MSVPPRLLLFCLLLSFLFILAATALFLSSLITQNLYSITYHAQASVSSTSSSLLHLPVITTISIGVFDLHHTEQPATATILPTTTLNYTSSIDQTCSFLDAATNQSSPHLPSCPLFNAARVLHIFICILSCSTVPLMLLTHIGKGFKTRTTCLIMIFVSAMLGMCAMAMEVVFLHGLRASDFVVEPSSGGRGDGSGDVVSVGVLAGEDDSEESRFETSFAQLTAGWVLALFGGLLYAVGMRTPGRLRDDSLA